MASKEQDVYFTCTIKANFKIDLCVDRIEQNRIPFFKKLLENYSDFFILLLFKTIPILFNFFD